MNKLELLNMSIDLCSRFFIKNKDLIKMEELQFFIRNNDENEKSSGVTKEYRLTPNKFIKPEFLVTTVENIKGVNNLERRHHYV